MANEDVLIVGKLEDGELRRSINELVDYVANQTSTMASSFKVSMDLMSEAMKDFAVTQKVSVSLIKESWKEMSTSFDAMFKAEKASTGGGSGSGRDTYEDDTIGKYRQETEELKRQREQMKMNSDELREQNRIIDERTRTLKEQTTSVATLRLDKALRMPSNDLDEATRKLRMLEIIQRRYTGTTELSEKQQKRLADAITKTKKEIDKINSAKPKTLKEVLGMDESSVDAITKKMKALRTVSVNPKNASEVRALGNEYQRLSRLQADLLGKGIQLTHSNNYLAQSFGYIRNRIVYAMTLGAVTNFIKQMYEVRSQYELLERSLGILIDDMRKGTQMFEELNKMALKSPFTLVELATGAKQLLAYNFAEEEVVDTTRRLADISAALGVPMERLVYNLGQIKAQTVLTARDARDFANAGLAIVPMLAQLYTEQKRFGNEIVTTAQVFDMMSKKLVSYNDVMQVINKVTDEGGKFFDFQGKQAQTLRVQMANLTLAWNNMLNEIGKGNQETLTMPIKGLKLLFENWKKVYDIIKDIIILYGLYRARAILVATINGTLITQAFISGMFQAGRAVRFFASAWQILSAAVVANPIGAVAAVITTAAVGFGLLNDRVDQAIEYQEKFGDSGAKVVRDLETYFDVLQNISKESSNYKKVMGELNSILGDYNAELISETDTADQINEKRRVGIQLIKEEILERKHLNEIEQGRAEYEAKVDNVRKKLRENLSEAITENFLGIGTINEELAKNAPAIANIISDVIENNINDIAGKTGKEYEEGVNRVFDIISQRMQAIGISEGTRNQAWLKNSIFRLFKDDIITDAIEGMVDAKNALDDYTEAIDRAYEAEKKAAVDGATFNDHVEQTQRRLMEAANDTEKFYKKIEQLIKDYSGENIIDFLVKVKTQVPAWMSQKGLSELTQLSARFSALATQAQKAGKSSLNLNGNTFTVDQLFQRAAQYAQAAQNKAADIESRKSSTITREASDALKEYKSAIEAVNVAKNRQKQGTADATLVQEKETEAQKAYNKALEKGVSVEDLRKAKEGKGKSGSKKDPLGDALTKQVQLISEMQKLYKEYQKVGIDADEARLATAKEYEKTLKSTNAQLAKFGIQGLDGEELATMDARALRDYYIQLRNIASLKGNTKGVEALEKAIGNLNKEITKIDYKKITDGLNNELGKLKDEYELAVELDASPDLGNIFADMLGLDADDMAQLPRDFNSLIKKMQSIIDANVTQGFDLLANLNKSDLSDWFAEHGIKQDSDLAKQLTAFVDYANKIRQDEMKKQIDNWDKLLEKYSEYQYQINKIQNDAAQERVTFARRFGTENQIDKAIDLKTKIVAATDPVAKQELVDELKQLVTDIAGDDETRLNIAVGIANKETHGIATKGFEEFQKTPEWVVATGNLAGMTDTALGMLIQRIEQYKKTAKNLDPKQIKEINRALKNLRNEQRKNNPFLAIGAALEEANERASEFEPELAKITKQIQELEDEEKKEGKLTDDKASQLTDLRKRYKEIKSLSKVSANEIVGYINNAISAGSKAVGIFTDMADALGGENMTQAAKKIKQVTSILEKGGEGAAIGAQIGGGWGAAIGGVLGTLGGVISNFADEWSGNADITEAIEDSTLKVKQLERAYKQLADAAEDAYGIAAIGAQRATITNKELQLVELKRQLQLEESRKEKNKDEERIESLKSEIIDLELEIKNATKDIVNDLLGISSIGDAAENLVNNMIQAFKNGEDYMKSYQEAFDNMVDNMIMKAIVGEVIGNKIKEMFEQVKAIALERANSTVVDALDIMNEWYTGAVWYENGEKRSTRKSVEDWRKYLEDALSRDNLWDDYREEYEKALSRLDEIYKQSANISPQDIDEIREMVTSWKGGVKDEFEMWMNAFGVSFGESNTADNLSALQQGIQGITEDTAGAIEAYMNGVSQQVYLQSDYLRQIVDALYKPADDMEDVQVATMSQILLQLRSSYEMQQAIKLILEGWSSDTGRSVRVEMV